MWPSLVKIQYTELNLSCGNDPVVKNLFIVMVTLRKNPIYFGVITIILFYDLYRRAYFVMHTFLVPNIFQKKTKFFQKIIYRGHSCGNDPVVKNSIYSNGDLDL
jgi:superoxide dismutase